MNPYKTPSDTLTCLLNRSQSVDSRHIRSFTGNYFIVLGWLSVISTIISVAMVYWTDYLHLDISFFIWFGLGAGLKQGSPTARKWAISIFFLMSLLAVLSLFPLNAKANIGFVRFDQTDPAYYVIVSLVWLVFAVPGIMLLSRRGQVAFTQEKEARVQERSATN